MLTIGVDTLAENFMDVLDILADPSRHSKIEDEELYTFLNQFLVKHKSYNILSTSQEAAVCAAAFVIFWHGGTSKRERESGNINYYMNTPLIPFLWILCLPIKSDSGCDLHQPKSSDLCLF